jgi:predicted small lipoprotein YifL
MLRMVPLPKRSLGRNVAFLTLLALAACGKQQPLQPPEGASLPPKPAMAATTPTVDELLTPPPVSRPNGRDTTLKRSEERQEDRFDLPPPG